MHSFNIEWQQDVYMKKKKYNALTAILWRKEKLQLS